MPLRKSAKGLQGLPLPGGQLRRSATVKTLQGIQREVELDVLLGAKMRIALPLAGIVLRVRGVGGIAKQGFDAEKCGDFADAGCGRRAVTRPVGPQGGCQRDLLTTVEKA